MAQLVVNMDRQPIQQLVITLIPTTIHVITNLPTYIPKGSTHQPPDGDSSRGSLPQGYPHGGPPFNPPIGSYGWPTPNPRMFIPPWYQPLVVQSIS